MAGEAYVAASFAFGASGTLTNGISFTRERTAGELEVYENTDVRLQDVFATQVKEIVTVTARYTADLMALVGTKATLVLTGVLRSNSDADGISATTEVATFTARAFLSSATRTFPRPSDGESQMQYKFTVTLYGET